MNVFKNILAILAIIFAALPAYAGNADIQCIQEVLNEYNLNAGPEDGLNGRGTMSALERFEDMANASLPILTEQTASGNCDVLKRQFITFKVNIDGIDGVDLRFLLFSSDSVSSDGAIAETTIISGEEQLVFIGKRLMENVKKFCVEAPAGYGFNGPNDHVYRATCDDLVGAKNIPTKTEINYAATLTK